MSAKGGVFERELCYALSAWWTGDPSLDPCFWRSSQSGGRATARRKAGKKVAGAHTADIAATDEVGLPFTRFVKVEAKRGYPSASLSDLLDLPPAQPPPLESYPRWIAQAKAAAELAQAPHWLLIHRRNKRDAVVVLTAALQRAVYGFQRRVSESAVVRAFVTHLGERLLVLRLDDFLELCDPDELKLASEAFFYKTSVSS